MNRNVRIAYQSPNQDFLNTMFQFMWLAMVGIIAVTISRSLAKEEPFYFRGLKFRAYPGGIGLQVYDPKERKWRDTDVYNRRTLERGHVSYYTSSLRFDKSLLAR